jgi:hypothetical protein
LGFVYRSTSNEGNCFVGVMAPSRDAVGRRFPMVVGVDVDAEPYRSFPHLLPLTFGALLQAVHECVVAGVRGGDIKVLAEGVEHLRWKPPPLIEEARGYTEWSQRATLEEAFAWTEDRFAAGPRPLPEKATPRAGHDDAPRA